MRLTTDALIIRENNNIGEADRFVTALTRELGLVRASARGAQNMKNRNASATQLLSYSRLTLFKGREKYIIDEAEPLRIFSICGRISRSWRWRSIFASWLASWPRRRSRQRSSCVCC